MRDRESLENILLLLVLDIIGRLVHYYLRETVYPLWRVFRGGIIFINNDAFDSGCFGSWVTLSIL